MTRTTSENQQHLDDYETIITQSDLPQNIDQEITLALYELSETGIEAQGKYRLRHKRGQKHRKAKALNHFEKQIEEWRSGSSPEHMVLFFEYLRKRCYDLYENTNAWDTISALANATSVKIAQYLDSDPPAGNQVLLCAIKEFLCLLEDDIAAFQAINRGTNHHVITSIGAALKKAQKILEILSPCGANGQSCTLGSWRAELGRELHAEARALHEVYRGIHCAALALARCEDEVRRYYDNDPGPVDVPSAHTVRQKADELDPEHWPSQKVTRDLNKTRTQVREIIFGLDGTRKKYNQELRSSASARVTELASRLNPWESLLRSMAAAYDDSKPMRLSSVRVRYCFPFAVRVNEEYVRGLSRALARRAPDGSEIVDGKTVNGRTEASHIQDVSPASGLARALGDRLSALGQGTPEVGSLKLSDFWTGAGEGMVGGNRVCLPAISDTHYPDDEWEVWIDLSRLENHCLCIERILINPTPHELYKALRCPGDYARGSEYRYGWVPGQSDPSTDQPVAPDYCCWRSIDEFAHDVILIVAQGLTSLQEPEFLKGHFHEIALVNTDVSMGELNGCYGEELFRTNLNRDTATLEEWLRYPISEHGGKPESIQGNFGYKENWWVVHNDTTIFGIVGNPSWQADSYLEAIQFAASWTPRLLLWNRNLMQALEQSGRRKNSSDLRGLEQVVRRSVASAHAEELCRLRSDRRYLEWMLDSVGTTSIQEDLERRIQAVRLLIAENEKNDQDIRDSRRNFLLGVLALFGVLNVSTVFAVLNAGDNSGFFRNHAAIRWEFIVQISLLFLFITVWLLTWRWQRRSR